MEETIVALSTPPGVGALSIIRLSGKDAIKIADAIFSKNILQKNSHTAHFGKILNKEGQTIDEVVLLIMKEGKSFTGEDSIEIMCHGNPLIVQKILRRSYECGARAAEGGEFSKRAYLNGKVDLLQAEAIKEMIHAKSEACLKEATKQLSGSLSIYIKDLQTRLIDLLSIIEVHIDYPEEGLEESTKKEVLSMINDTREKIITLISSFDDGKKLMEGFKVSILGAPNAGKSSLLNALLKENRAIVTDIAGTTRDTISEEISIKGHLITFVDTAGIRKTDDVIERIGIEKSIEAANTCDLCLVLIDSTKEVPKETADLLHKIENAIIVYTKSDLVKVNNDEISISIKKEKSIEKLKDVIIKKTATTESNDSIMITKERHHIALQESLQALEKAYQGIKEEISIDLSSFDLREALNSLSSVIGMDVSEEILGGIFSKFCVGK